MLCDSADVQGQGGDQRYATLSHCWGSSRDFLTTRESLAQMKEGFRLSDRLPKTFSDAILVAHKLGIPYLWIDSLCIVQYDESDWAVESSRMASVYSNSYLTIAAAASDGDDKGFLELRPFEYTTVKFTSPKGESAIAYLSRRESHPGSSSGYDDPLFRRAWVLQEQYLSQRTLVFSEKQIYFFCQEMHGDPKYAESTRLDPLNSGFKRVIFDWREIPKELSTRQLTYDTDKLPSIAGVASVVSTERGGNHRQYCAGLWRDELPRDLLFYRIGEAAVPEQFLAPSWSWAALNGPVLWLADECLAGRRSREVLHPLDTAKVADCKMILKDTRNPYGQVDTGSSLAICSHFIELTPCLAGMEISDSSEIPRWQTPKENLGHPYEFAKKEIRHSPEKHISQRIVWCKFDAPGPKPDKVMGLVLACRYIQANHEFEKPEHERWKGLVGILVTLTGGQSGLDGYTRVGIFEIYTGDGVAGQITDGFPPRTVVLY